MWYFLGHIKYVLLFGSWNMVTLFLKSQKTYLLTEAITFNWGQNPQDLLNHKKRCKL